MMYYGAGSIGWIWMGLAMIAFWGVVLWLVISAATSFGRGPQTKQPPSGALGVLQERFARGEISNEEFTQKKQLILPAG